MSEISETSSVGKLKIHLRRLDKTDGAKVTLEVLRSDATGGGNNGSLERVFLVGIRVQRSPQNWIELTLPDPATWEQSLKRLPPSVVSRIQSAEFYETIRQQICQRFLAPT